MTGSGRTSATGCSATRDSGGLGPLATNSSTITSGSTAAGDGSCRLTRLKGREKDIGEGSGGSMRVLTRVSILGMRPTCGNLPARALGPLEVAGGCARRLGCAAAFRRSRDAGTGVTVLGTCFGSCCFTEETVDSLVSIDIFRACKAAAPGVLELGRLALVTLVWMGEPRAAHPRHQQTHLPPAQSCPSWCRMPWAAFAQP